MLLRYKSRMNDRRVALVKPVPLSGYLLSSVPIKLTRGLSVVTGCFNTYSIGRICQNPWSPQISHEHDDQRVAAPFVAVKNENIEGFWEVFKQFDLK